MHHQPPPSNPVTDHTPELSAWQTRIEQVLDDLLPPASQDPGTLHRAMRYSTLGSGKHFRPVLVYATGKSLDLAIEQLDPIAAAVEFIHAYSLIHDDLPAMDDDDFRRGKPTNHKVYGEGIAVLAGDALLTQAFEIAARCEGWPRYSHKDVILEIADTAGSLKLIAGQVADLEGEGRKTSARQLKYIHERKTSALLCCSVRLGGMSANCAPSQLKALTDFGYNVGLAFQIIDDILDVTQTSEKLGKTAGKDAAVQKATYPSIIGMDKSRRKAKELTEKAFGALKTFRGRAAALEAIAAYLLLRDC